MAFLSRISTLSSRSDARASRVGVAIVGCLMLGVVVKGGSRQPCSANPMRTWRYAWMPKREGKVP